MNYSDKIVSTIPLDKIWTSSKLLDSQRIAYLTSDDIVTLLSQTKLNFVIANVGDKLKWVDLDNCYSFWKSEVKIHIAKNIDSINLDEFPENYAYLTSQWTSETQPIILLEKCH